MPGIERVAVDGDAEGVGELRAGQQRVASTSGLISSTFMALILDDFAIRELTASQADDLYELVTSRAAAGRSLVLTSNRSPVDWYPLFPNPVIAESLLDRLINTSHQVFMNGPSYRPNKRPGRAPETAKEASE